MKKITLLTVLISFVMVDAKAQDTLSKTPSKWHYDSFISYHQYGLQYGCFGNGICFWYEANTRWWFGGGCDLEGIFTVGLKGEKDSDLLTRRISVSSGKVGLYASTACRLRHGFVIMDGWVGCNSVGCSAYDENCEIEYETESSTSITHNYQLSRVDGQKWGPSIIGSIRVSYLTPITDILAIKFTVGYDLCPRIYKDRLDSNCELTSTNWSDFEMYYGHPSTNLYETSESVRKICNASRFYFGITFDLFH